MINVTYDGRYPNACSGVMKIYRNGELVYRFDQHSFHSTGDVWFDKDWEEHVEDGELVLSEEAAEKFEAWLESQEDKDAIRNCVNTALSEVTVCCGGCV